MYIIALHASLLQQYTTLRTPRTIPPTLKLLPTKSVVKGCKDYFSKNHVDLRLLDWALQSWGGGGGGGEGGGLFWVQGRIQDSWKGEGGRGGGCSGFRGGYRIPGKGRGGPI